MKDTKLLVAVGVLIAKLVFSVTITSAQMPIEANRTHGESCGPYQHCRMDAALICTDGLCACSSGKVSDKYGYDLEWVVPAGRCLSRLNSVCIGTSQNPAASKEIQCLGAGEGSTRCEQMPDLPLGVGLCRPPSQPLHLHGQPCSETRHCDAAAGLVCSVDANTCSCATGALTGTYSYDLRWDNEKGRCVGNVGSACVGTQDNPLSHMTKRIECVTDNGCINVRPVARCELQEVQCQQIQGLPLGIGFCKENFLSETTTTNQAETTPITGQPETTASNPEITTRSTSPFSKPNSIIPAIVLIATLLSL